MQLTTNLKLKKPEIADAVNIDDLNSNADTIDTEVAKIASTSQAGRMSITDKTKLDGIQAGAQVNAVTSVVGRTGAVTLSKSDVGLSSVDNAKQATKTEFDSHVADEVKHITATERTAWNAKASTAAATSSAAGLMAAVDKSKLDGIAAGAQVNRTQATTVQATGGTDTTTDMSPQRTMQSVDSRTRYGVTTGNLTSYTLTLNPAPSTLYTGMEVRLKLHVSTGTNPTLNVNGLGVYWLKDSDGNTFSGEAGNIYCFIWDGTSFFLRSGGGGGKLNVWSHYAGGYPDVAGKRRGIVIASVVPINDIVADNNLWTANSWTPNNYSNKPGNSTAYKGTAEWGGLIYSLDSDGNTVRYNPSTNSWATLAKIPSYGQWMTLTAIAGKLYALGTPTGALYIYTIATNTWTTGTSAPYGAQYHSATSVGSKLYYMAGGSDAGTAGQPYTYSYDPATNAWTQLANYNPTYGHTIHASAAIGTEIFLFGGFQSNGSVLRPFTRKYNTITNVWSSVADAPQTLGYHQATAVGMKIYITGGSSGSTSSAIYGYSPRLLIYDMPTNTWSVGQDMPVARLGHGAAFYNGFLFLIGGNIQTGFTNQVIAFGVVSKFYPAGTVVIFRMNEAYGAWQTELMTPKKALLGVNTRLLTHFDNVLYHDGTTLRNDLPTYYGDGNNWLQFK